jgi:Arc/MetJ-type ribon-helix-helix transcriptional regulator
MALQLRPELEALVMKDVERGPYRSVDDFVEQAVTMLHEQEEYLAANREKIAQAIEEGWAEAQRGELLDPQEVKREMAAMKQEWLAKRKGA